MMIERPRYHGLLDADRLDVLVVDDRVVGDAVAHLAPDAAVPLAVLLEQRAVGVLADEGAVEVALEQEGVAEVVGDRGVAGLVLRAAVVELRAVHLGRALGDHAPDAHADVRAARSRCRSSSASSSGCRRRRPAGRRSRSLPSDRVAVTESPVVLDGGDRGAEAYVDPGGDARPSARMSATSARDGAHRRRQVGAAHRRRRDLHDHVAVGGAHPQLVEGEAALGELVVDPDLVERLERVALQGDAVADAAHSCADLDAGRPRRPSGRGARDSTPPVMPPPTTRTRRVWDSDMALLLGRGWYGVVMRRTATRGRR